MAVSNLYVLYAVDVDPITGANAVFIDQVSDFRLGTNIAELLMAGDGQVDPTFVGVGTQNAGLTFTTSALAAVLAKCGINGIKIDSDVTHDGLEGFFQAVDEGGTRKGAASHVKLTINEGILVPRTLNAAHGTPATLGLECVATYDGSNEPIVIATGQSLLGTPSTDQLFTVGPVKINGSAVDGIQAITIDFGLQLVTVGGDGDVWPTFCGIMARQPLITITTPDAAALSTFGLDGTAQSATDSVVYLRKLAEGGTRVADGTAEHISFTIDEGIITVDTVGGAHGRELAAAVRIRPTYDGTNAILVINTATAIT